MPRSGESEKAGHPRTDQFNHPTDVAIDSDGDIYVCDWGNHRVCVFDPEGGPITTLIGDAHVLPEDRCLLRDFDGYSSYVDREDFPIKSGRVHDEIGRI